MFISIYGMNKTKNWLWKKIFKATLLVKISCFNNSFLFSYNQINTFNTLLFNRANKLFFRWHSAEINNVPICHQFQFMHIDYIDSWQVHVSTMKCQTSPQRYVKCFVANPAKELQVDKSFSNLSSINSNLACWK